MSVNKEHDSDCNMANILLVFHIFYLFQKLLSKDIISRKILKNITFRMQNKRRETRKIFYILHSSRCGSWLLFCH